MRSTRVSTPPVLHLVKSQKVPSSRPGGLLRRRPENGRGASNSFTRSQAMAPSAMQLAVIALAASTVRRPAAAARGAQCRQHRRAACKFAPAKRLAQLSRSRSRRFRVVPAPHGTRLAPRGARLDALRLVAMRAHTHFWIARANALKRPAPRSAASPGARPQPDAGDAQLDGDRELLAAAAAGRRGARPHLRFWGGYRLLRR